MKSRADFINSLNLTISGIVIMSKGYTTSGASHEPSCVANAWITQFSVQMVDFNILVISITVLMTVTSSRPVAETASLRTSMLLCAATWIPSLITSSFTTPSSMKRREIAGRMLPDDELTTHWVQVTSGSPLAPTGT